MVRLKLTLTPEQWIYLRRFARVGAHNWKYYHNYREMGGSMREMYKRREKEIDELCEMLEGYEWHDDDGEKPSSVS